MAYRADIEIAVKGAQELKRLQDQVRATSKLVDGLNNYLENIGGGGIVRSINNLNKAVADTAGAFNKAALGTDEAALAARNFVAANRQLTRGLEERLTLLKSITEQERRQRLSAAGIRETTQYGGVIGPGPASPVGSLVGQKSPVAERINQTLQARKDEIQLQAALLRLEEKSAATLNEKLELQQRLNRAALMQGKTDVEIVSAQAARRQRFLAGQSGTAVQGPLAGPGAMGFPVALSLSKVEQQGLATAAKKQEILQRMAATRQSLVGLAANLQRLDLNSAVAIADAVRNQEQLNAAKARQNKIQNAGFGVQGPALPPQKGAKRGGRLGGAISGSIIGGAFPLLFGQGAGAAAGGAAGGLIGGFFGPGGSFAGSLLGTLFGDIAEQGGKIKELAADIGFSADQTTRLQNAFALAGQEADKFQAAVQNIRGLGLSLDDQADAIALAANLTEAYGGKIDKIAAAYANFVEKGKVGISDINKFTSEGIPILDELEKKYNTNRDGILKLAKDGKISAQDLSDALINIGNSSDTAVKKTVNGWDKAWADIKAGGSLLGQAISASFNALVGSAGSSTASIAESFGSMFKNIVQYSIDATAALARNLANLARFGANVSATAELGGLNIGATASKNILKNIETNARNFDAALQKIDLPTPGKVGPITVPGQAPATGTGGGGKDRAKKERESQLADILAANGLFRSQETIAARIAVAEVDRNTAEVARLQHVERSVQLLHEAAAIHRSDVPLDEKQAKLRGVQDKLVASTNQYEREIATQKIAQIKTANEIIADLELELKLKTATTEQERERLRIEAERAKLEAQMKGLPQPQIDQALALQAEIAKPKTERQKIESRLGQVEDELTTLISLSNQVTSAADAIGTAFGNSFKGLISGTMSAQQALASFFSSVADHFLDMASKIIAKMIEMFILKQVLGIFGGALGGGLGGGFTASGAGFGGSNSFSTFDAGGAFAFGMPSLFAEGGFVTGPTNAIIGEGGESEYVIPASKMNAAMSRYSRGARGEGVIPASGGSDGGNVPVATGGVATIDVRYSVERINSVDYVTADQFQTGLRQAANQGAARGEQATMRRLQQSRSTRSRLGLN